MTIRSSIAFKTSTSFPKTRTIFLVSMLCLWMLELWGAVYWALRRVYLFSSLASLYGWVPFDIFCFFFFKKKRFIGYKKLLTFSNWWCRSSSLDCYMEAENNLEHAILAYLWLICLFSCWILIIAFYSFIFNM